MRFFESYDLETSEYRICTFISRKSQCPSGAQTGEFLKEAGKHRQNNTTTQIKLYFFSKKNETEPEPQDPLPKNPPDHTDSDTQTPKALVRNGHQWVLNYADRHRSLLPERAPAQKPRPAQARGVPATTPPAGRSARRGPPLENTGAKIEKKAIKNKMNKHNEWE